MFQESRQWNEDDEKKMVAPLNDDILLSRVFFSPKCFKTN